MKLGRNDLCPCGSGRKVKRCCGVEGVQRWHAAAGELLGLAFHFPRYRPVTPAFEAWSRTAPDGVSREAVGDGVGRLDWDERERIVDGFAAEQPELWSSLVADLGDETLAVDLMLGGAVVAGLEERRHRPTAKALALLEGGAEVRGDPVAALALTLRGSDLWSVVESEQAAAELEAQGIRRPRAVLRSQADRLGTAWHRERLLVLVSRLRAGLPEDGHPLASAALERACELIESEKGLARRVSAELLLDSLPRLLAAAA